MVDMYNKKRMLHEVISSFCDSGRIITLHTFVCWIITFYH